MNKKVRRAVFSSLIGMGEIFFCGHAYAKSKNIVHKIKAVRRNESAQSLLKSDGNVNFSEGSANAKITKKQIDALGGTANALSILKLSPGVNVTSSNIMGTRANISIRGFSGTQSAYTFDGIPIGDLWNGGFQAGNAQLGGAYNLVPVTSGEISGVKILYGPAPSNILSIGGLGGTIQYSPLLPQKKFGISVFGGYGSYDSLNYGASLNTGSNQKYGNMYLRFSSKQTQNYQYNTPDRQYSYYISYKFPSLSPYSNLTGIAYINRNQGYIPQHLPEAIYESEGPNYQFPQSDTYQEAESQFLFSALDYKALLSSAMGTNIKLFYTSTNFDSLKYTNPEFTQETNYNGSIGSLFPATESSYQNIGYTPSSLDGVDNHSYHYDTATIGISPSISLFLNKINTKLEVGGLAMLSGYRSGIYWYNSAVMPKINQYNDAYDEHGTRTYYKVYGMLKTKFGNLNIYPGVSYDVESTHFDDVTGYYYAYSANSHRQYSAVSPYIGFKYLFNHNLSITGTYSLASEFPNVSAFYSADDAATSTTPAPTPIVDPEKVKNSQVGLKYATHNYGLSLTLYRSQFEHTFANYYDPTTGITTVYNSAPSIRQGIELSGKSSINRNMYIYGNYSIQKGFYSSSYTGVFGTRVKANTPIQYVPTYTANLGLGLKYNKLSARFWYNAIGSQYVATSSGVPTSKSLSAYGTLNLSLQYTRNIDLDGLENATLSFIASNLLNSQPIDFAEQFPTFNGNGSYYEVSGQLPRFLGVNFKLNFN